MINSRGELYPALITMDGGGLRATNLLTSESIFKPLMVSGTVFNPHLEEIEDSPKYVMGSLSIKDPVVAAKKGITEQNDGIYIGDIKILPKVMVVTNG